MRDRDAVALDKARMRTQRLRGVSLFDGLQRGLDPGGATNSPYRDADAASLPATLAEALDALAANSVLQQGLGAAMARVADSVKRQEIARHAAADDKALWERREYFGNR